MDKDWSALIGSTNREEWTVTEDRLACNLKSGAVRVFATPYMAALMEYAKQEHRADHLWVLEKNERAIRFYEAHGFSLSGQRRLEAGTTEYVIKMLAIE